MRAVVMSGLVDVQYDGCDSIGVWHNMCVRQILFGRCNLVDMIKVAVPKLFYLSIFD